MASCIPLKSRIYTWIETVLGFKLNIYASEGLGIAALCKNKKVHDVVYLVIEHIKTCQVCL